MTIAGCGVLIDEVVFFCAGCAAREFGTRGTLLDGPECEESP